MGEIIRVDFKKKKAVEKERPKKESTSKTETFREIIDETTYYTRFMHFMMRRGGEKLMRLNVSPSSLQRSRETVGDYTTEELLEWLENSNENDWKKKAAFFQAIYKELEARLGDR